MWDLCFFLRHGFLDSVEGEHLQLMDAIRYATFQVTSLLTTTGFTTADYESGPRRPDVPVRGLLYRGLRRFHHQRHQGRPLCGLCKFMSAAIKKFSSSPCPSSPSPEPAPGGRFHHHLSVCYFIVNIFMVLGGGCVMVLTDDMDYVTGMSSVIATLMNIGPGFGAVGPSENYAFISDAGKWFLSYNMLVGRLEMFSALVIFYPSFWKR
jgi:trk system potassium uptake protein TrkH